MQMYEKKQRKASGLPTVAPEGYPTPEELSPRSSV